MRKVVNGRLYDTDTARIIYDWDNGELCGDINYVAHELYRKKTGEFFLHIEGGPATSWAEARGLNGTRRGEHIVPVSYDEARALVERNADADVYEELFGLADDESTVVITVRGVDARAKALLDREASRTGRTLGEILSDCILSILG